MPRELEGGVGVPLTVERRRDALREAPAEVERLDALFDIAALTGFPATADLNDLRQDAADAAEALMAAQSIDDLRKAKDAFDTLRKAQAPVWQGP